MTRGPWRPALNGIQQDALVFHGLRFPGRSPNPYTWACLVLGSGGLWVLSVHRLGRACHAWVPLWSVTRALRSVLVLGFVILRGTCQVMTKSDVASSLIEMEPGLYLSDAGHIQLGARSVGAGTIIHHHVTIGRGRRSDDKAEIGRDVWIGPRCVIYGRIWICDGATVLPGSVLTRDAPAGSVVGGNPATMLRQHFDNLALRSSLEFDGERVHALLG